MTSHAFQNKTNIKALMQIDLRSNTLVEVSKFIFSIQMLYLIFYWFHWLIKIFETRFSKKKRSKSLTPDRV